MSRTALKLVGGYYPLPPLTNFAYPVYHVSLDRTWWELQISVGVEKGELVWPNS